MAIRKKKREEIPDASIDDFSIDDISMEELEKEFDTPTNLDKVTEQIDSKAETIAIPKEEIKDIGKDIGKESGEESGKDIGKDIGKGGGTEEDELWESFNDELEEPETAKEPVELEEPSLEPEEVVSREVPQPEPRVEREQPETKEKPAEKPKTEAENRQSKEKTLIEQMDGEILYIPVEHISIPKKLYTRREDSTDDISQQCAVRRTADGFELVAGGVVPCFVIDADDDAATLITADWFAKSENPKTKEKASIIHDEITAFERLSGQTQDEAVVNVADLNGMSQEEVEAYLSLDDLIIEFIPMLGSGISMSGARILSQMPKEKQALIYDTMSDKHMNEISSNHLRKLLEMGDFKEKDILGDDSITMTREQFREAFSHVFEMLLKELETGEEPKESKPTPKTASPRKEKK